MGPDGDIVAFGRLPGTPLYDDPGFFAGYADMRTHPGRLNEVVEVPAVMSLMPALAGCAVADLGCGSGGMCRRMVTGGAASVVGYDVSTRMLALARDLSSDRPEIAYHHADLEELSFEGVQFDLVVSSLAMHYVANLEALACRVGSALRPGASFIFSVEHPIVTCDARDWCCDPAGARIHWPVDRYLDEGRRTVSWLGFEGVPRVHRTVSGYLTGLLAAGLILRHVLEPGPDENAVKTWPRLADQRRRPPFLVVRADKPV